MPLDCEYILYEKQIDKNDRLVFGIGEDSLVRQASHTGEDASAEMVSQELQATRIQEDLQEPDSKDGRQPPLLSRRQTQPPNCRNGDHEYHQISGDIDCGS